MEVVALDISHEACGIMMQSGVRGVVQGDIFELEGEQFEYRGELGSWYSWLHNDPDTLTEHARGKKFSCEILVKSKGGEYLRRFSF
jgi:hypothetical protein